MCLHQAAVVSKRDREPGKEGSFFSLYINQNISTKPTQAAKFSCPRLSLRYMLCALLFLFSMESHLWGTCICGMSSRAEFVGCAHKKFAKSSLPMPNNLFGVFWWIGWLKSEETRHIVNLTVYSFNKQELTDVTKSANVVVLVELVWKAQPSRSQKYLMGSRSGPLGGHSILSTRGSSSGPDFGDMGLPLVTESHLKLSRVSTCFLPTSTTNPTNPGSLWKTMLPVYDLQALWWRAIMVALWDQRIWVVEISLLWVSPPWDVSNIPGLFWRWYFRSLSWDPQFVFGEKPSWRFPIAMALSRSVKWGMSILWTDT